MSEKRYKIICNLPNAASDINGIRFEDRGGTFVAFDVSESDAKRFESIPGYDVTLEDSQTNDLSDPKRVLASFNKMNVTDIKAFLKAQPNVWNDVLTLEEQRTEPRPGVMDAVKAAKASLE